MYKRIRELVVALACALTLNECAAAPAAAGSIGAQLRTASYDGSWSGEVNCLYDPGIWPDDDCAVQFTFQIEGDTFAVEQRIRSKANKVNSSNIDPGRFSFSKVLTNAVALSMASELDDEGRYVETWSFVMTLEDPDHMRVHWTRVVNNTDMPLGQKGSKFSSVGMGVFKRVPANK